MNIWKLFKSKKTLENTIPPINKKITKIVWIPYNIPILTKIISVNTYKSTNTILFNIDPICKTFKKDIDISTFTEKIEYQCIESVNCLTYNGVMKYFYVYLTSKHAIDFQKWYEIEIMENQNYCNVLLSLFSNFDFPCIYLLYIGNYKGYTNVYKFGRTDNFYRRYKELNKHYSTTFKITTLQFIDPEYLPKAEVEVNKFVSKYLIPDLENFTELISIDSINPVIALYKELGIKWSTNTKNLKEKISELEHKLEIVERDNLILKKDNELLLKDNKLLTLEIKK